MNPGTSYPPTSFALLLIGHSGTGKSTAAMGFPKPWFLDLDRNLKNAEATWKQKGYTPDWLYDNVEHDKQGKPVAVSAQWPHAVGLIRAACADPQVKTIVIDSTPVLQDILCDYLVAVGGDAEKPLNIGGERVMTLSLWNPFYKLIRNLLCEIRSKGKLFILTCHLATEKNEVSGMLEYVPNISGQWKTQLARLFTDYWQTDTRPVARNDANKAGVEYFIRTAPTPRLSLKCSVPTLIPEFVFTPDKVAFLATTPATVDPAKV